MDTRRKILNTSEYTWDILIFLPIKGVSPARKPDEEHHPQGGRQEAYYGRPQKKPKGPPGGEQVGHLSQGLVPGQVAQGVLLLAGRQLLLEAELFSSAVLMFFFVYTKKPIPSLFRRYSVSIIPLRIIPSKKLFRQYYSVTIPLTFRQYYSVTYYSAKQTKFLYTLYSSRGPLKLKISCSGMALTSSSK